MNPNFRKAIGQALHWFTLLDQKGTPATQLQALYESGILSAVLDANVEDVNMGLLREALGLKNLPEPVLCYVEGDTAYFTTQELSKQWGDDWDIAPYEHNAGPPYGPSWHNEPKNLNDAFRGWKKPGIREPLAPGELCRMSCCTNDWNEDGTPKWQIIQAKWRGPFMTPADLPYLVCSVKEINAGRYPWLVSRGQKRVRIMAGTTLTKFTRLVEWAGGKVVISE